MAKKSFWLNLARSNQADETGRIRIAPGRIYILPTGFGLVYAALLILLLIGSINYANNLGFLLTFLLAALGLVAMVHSWRNLAGLELVTMRVEPVFAGEEARFCFEVESSARRTRPDLELGQDKGPVNALDYQPLAQNRLCVQVRAQRRGWLAPGRIRLASRYPLGIFRAWTYLETSSRALVWPAPLPWPVRRAESPGSADWSGLGQRHPDGDEFHGLRPYQPGDSLRHIHWRSLARADVLVSMEYERPPGQKLWLSLDEAPGPGLETRLGQLCHAVLQALEEQQPFGLRLGAMSIEPGMGDGHRMQVLQALALYGKTE